MGTIKRLNDAQQRLQDAENAEAIAMIKPNGIATQ